MTIYGAPTYLPNGQFSFSRAYIDQIVFGFGVGALFSQAGGNFFITDGTNPIVHVVCNFYAPFWVWSGNGYSIDHLVVDWWLLTDPSPTPIPLNFNLAFRYDGTTFKRQFFLYIAGYTTEYVFDLPGAPPGYWQFNPDT